MKLVCWIKVLLDSSHSNVSMDDIQVSFIAAYGLMNNYNWCYQVWLFANRLAWTLFQKDLSPLVNQIAPENDGGGSQIP